MVDKDIKGSLESQTWFKRLDERTQKEIKFAIEYSNNFNHGTDGHIRLITIARLAELLRQYYIESNSHLENYQKIKKENILP